MIRGHIWRITIRVILIILRMGILCAWQMKPLETERHMGMTRQMENLRHILYGRRRKIIE